MMPNQANGYSRKLCVRRASGTWARQIEREPSAPTSRSQRTSCRTPSLSTNRIAGSVMSTDVSLTPNRTSPPSRSRAFARSTNTSVCG